MSAVQLDGSGADVVTRDQRILDRTRYLSMALVALGIVLWQFPPFRGHDVFAIGVIGISMGIPHGAVDFLLPQNGTQPRHLFGLVWMVGLYIASAIVGILLVFVVPILVYLGVLALAVFHWGGSDASFRRARSGERATYGDVVEIIAYGAPIIFFGAALWPGEVRKILTGIANGLANSTQTAFDYVAWVTLAAIVVFVIRMIRARKWTEVIEVLLLSASATFVPPAVAFGIYFGCWHSLRNTVRLFVDARVPSQTVPNADLAHVGVRRLVRMMIFGTVGALTFVALAVVVATLTRGAAVFDLGSWAVVILASVVAPHVITVLRYDVWKLRMRAR